MKDKNVLPKTPAQKFAIANDIEFYDACLDFYDGADKQKRNFLQNVGDRVRLITVLEAKGFTIERIKPVKTKKLVVAKKSKGDVTVKISEKAEIEVINFDKSTAWVRWYLPDFSDNGNIELPKGKNYKLKERVGNQVTVEAI